MESPRDPLPAYVSGEPDPADPRSLGRPPGRCWVVLAVRRSPHEARAALAPGGITYWSRFQCVLAQ
jgi:hypothetical protein